MTDSLSRQGGLTEKPVVGGVDGLIELSMVAYIPLNCIYISWTSNIYVLSTVTLLEPLSLIYQEESALHRQDKLPSTAKRVRCDDCGFRQDDVSNYSRSDLGPDYVDQR